MWDGALKYCRLQLSFLSSQLLKQHRKVKYKQEVGVMTEYGLDGRDSFPGRERFLSCPQRPDRPGAHPASYPIRTGGGG
jgi:hypothetical protein